jgi:hypothetical protein
MPNTVKYTPGGSPLDVEVSVNSPQSVTYRGQYKLPGGTWVDFARATDPETVNQSGHTYALDQLQSGTSLQFQFAILGNPGDTFQAAVTVTQQGSPSSPPFQVTAKTNDSGAAVARLEVVLQ